MSEHDKRYTDSLVIRIVRDFWPLIVAVLSVAIYWGSVRADICLIPDQEKRISKLEQSQSDMREDVQEIKKDVKILLLHSRDLR